MTILDRHSAWELGKALLHRQDIKMPIGEPDVFPPININERLRFDNSGGCGWGMTSPTAKLEITTNGNVGLANGYIPHHLFRAHDSDGKAKCEHCGQWGEWHTCCKYCGAPIE